MMGRIPSKLRLHYKLVLLILTLMLQMFVLQYLGSMKTGHKHIFHMRSNTKKWKESIHVSTIACGNRAPMAIVSLKSAVLFTNSHLIFHISAELRLHDYFEKTLNSWPQNIRQKFDFYLYNITKKDKLWNESPFRLCVAERLFLPSLLNDVDALIYADTDILFLRPIDKLWNKMKSFNKSQVAAMGPDCAKIYNPSSWRRNPYYGSVGFNAGLIVMNLTRIRLNPWFEPLISYFYQYKKTHHDQHLLNTFFYFHPEKLYVLQPEENFIDDHCLHINTFKGVIAKGIAVLHGTGNAFRNHKVLKAVYEDFKKVVPKSDFYRYVIRNEGWFIHGPVFCFPIEMTSKPVASDMHRFEDDVEGLLASLRTSLVHHRSEKCAKMPHIFTRQIEMYSKKHSN